MPHSCSGAALMDESHEALITGVVNADMDHIFCLANFKIVLECKYPPVKHFKRGWQMFTYMDRCSKCEVTFSVVLSQINPVIVSPRPAELLHNISDPPGIKFILKFDHFAFYCCRISRMPPAAPLLQKIIVAYTKIG